MVSKENVDRYFDLLKKTLIDTQVAELDGDNVVVTQPQNLSR